MTLIRINLLRKLFVTFLFLTVSTNVLASFNKNLFSPIIYSANANNHLTNKEVTELTQDERGFIWVGTIRGLFRYDGYEYKKIVLNIDGYDFSKVYVRSLLIDRQGMLWIGSMTDGLFQLNTISLQVTQYTHNPNNKSSISSNQINGLAQNNNGELWIGTSYGLDKLDIDSESFTHFRSSENSNERFFNYIINIKLDANQQLWLATAKGLARFNHKDKSFSRVAYQTSKTPGNISPNNIVIRAIQDVSDGRLWLATQKYGSYIYDPNTRFFKALAPDNSQNLKINSAIIQVNDKEVWIAGYSGIEIRDVHTGNLVKSIKANAIDKYGIAGNVITTMLRSRSGLIFMGVMNKGLQFYNPDSKGFQRLDKYLPALLPLFEDPTYKVIKLSPYQLLIISQNKAVQLNIENAQVTPVVELSNFQDWPINNAIKLSNNQYWFAGKDNQLLNYDQENNQYQVIEIPNTRKKGMVVRGVIQTADKEILVSTGQSIHRLNTNTLKFSRLVNEDGSPFIVYVKKLFMDSKNRIWLSTTNGLGLVENKQTIVKMFSTKSGTAGTLSDNYIVEVAEDSQGNIFVNNRFGIDKLVSYTPEQLRFKPFAQYATKKLNKDSALLPLDNTNYWLGTRFKLSSKGEILDEFDIADGAIEIANTRSMFPLTTDIILHVTANAITFINRSEISPWKYQPPVVVTSISKGGKPDLRALLNNELQLLPEDDQFSIQFSSLDFTMPHKNLYRYKLEGYDKDWIMTSSYFRQAKYTSLPPGNYRLLIDGSNRKGMWSQNPRIIKVTVEPQIYQTWWFKTLLFILGGIIVYIIAIWRVRKSSIKEHKENEMKLVKQRAEMMAELVEKKNQLLADVSHELRTPLTVLQLKVEALRYNLVKDVDASYESLMVKIADINKLIASIYQLSQSDIGALKLELTTINGYQTIEQWSIELSELVKAQGFEWQQNIQLSETTNIILDKDKIKQVLSNLVSNSIAYTDLPGKINFSSQIKAEQLELIIEDSSPGVSTENMQRIFERLFRVETSRSRATGGSGLGLSICKSIVEAHNGNITASSSALGGLAINITLPLVNQ